MTQIRIVKVGAVATIGRDDKGSEYSIPLKFNPIEGAVYDSGKTNLRRTTKDGTQIFNVKSLRKREKTFKKITVRTNFKDFNRELVQPPIPINVRGLLQIAKEISLGGITVPIIRNNNLESVLQRFSLGKANYLVIFDATTLGKCAGIVFGDYDESYSAVRKVLVQLGLGDPIGYGGATEREGLSGRPWYVNSVVLDTLHQPVNDVLFLPSVDLIVSGDDWPFSKKLLRRFVLAARPVYSTEPFLVSDNPSLESLRGLGYRTWGGLEGVVILKDGYFMVISQTEKQISNTLRKIESHWEITTEWFGLKKEIGNTKGGYGKADKDLLALQRQYPLPHQYLVLTAESIAAEKSYNEPLLKKCMRAFTHTFWAT